ncbi:hypothetical protein F5Y06DRAFT_252171 [Hypoxylon sp. FL0890]|nr:hypothetical protein F5Y06DRAFT_252171 [Hypoxylon sp. FL0890]
MLATRSVVTARNSAGAVSRGRIAFPYWPAINSYISKASTPITSFKFSTTSSRPEKKQSTKDSSKPPEELPAFSFDGLGMSRNTKIAVIVILSIFGTIETIFWIKWIWNWFSGTKDDEPRIKS